MSDIICVIDDVVREVTLWGQDDGEMGERRGSNPLRLFQMIRSLNPKKRWGKDEY